MCMFNFKPRVVVASNHPRLSLTVRRSKEERQRAKPIKTVRLAVDTPQATEVSNLCNTYTY
jgi:hypothetical protein